MPTTGDKVLFGFLSVFTVGILPTVCAIDHLCDSRSEELTKAYIHLIHACLGELNRLEECGYDLELSQLDIEIPTEINDGSMFRIQQKMVDGRQTITCGFTNSDSIHTVAKNLKDFHRELERCIGIYKSTFISAMREEGRDQFGIGYESPVVPQRGFVNLSNTCYANSSLKTLIFSIGASSLYQHLEELLVTNKKRIENLTTYLELCKSGSSPDEKARLDESLKTDTLRIEIIKGNGNLEQNASRLQQEVVKRYQQEAGSLPNYNQVIESFLPVLTDCCVGKVALKLQLISFFNTLQKTDLFKGFVVTGVQQDPQEFISKLNVIFELDKIKGRQIQVIQNKKDANNPDRKDRNNFINARYEWKLESNVAEDMTLQNMFDQLLAEEEVELVWEGDKAATVTLKSNSYVLDTSVGNRIFHHINAINYSTGVASKVKLTNLGVNSPVTFMCIDSIDNKPYEITLEARQVIIHHGFSANSGHYYMYSKREDGSWDIHDDADIYTTDRIHSKEQAKFINYEIVKREEIARG